MQLQLPIFPKEAQLNQTVMLDQLVTKSFTETMKMLEYPLNGYEKLPEFGIKEKLLFRKSLLIDTL